MRERFVSVQFAVRFTLGHAADNHAFDVAEGKTYQVQQPSKGPQSQLYMNLGII